MAIAHWHAHSEPMAIAQRLCHPAAGRGVDPPGSEYCARWIRLVGRAAGASAATAGRWGGAALGAD